jgi:hypothetical protein
MRGESGGCCFWVREIKKNVASGRGLAVQLREKRKKFKGRKADQGKIGKNQSAIFGGNSRPFGAPLCPKSEKKCKFKVKLNDYWINLHKN